MARKKRKPTNRIVVQTAPATFTIWTTWHPKNDVARMAAAWHIGTGWKIRSAYEFKDAKDLADYNLTYGILRGFAEIHKACIAEGKNFIYVDHGYIGDDRRENARYRVVLNNLQHIRPPGSTGDSNGKRWDELGLEIHPPKDPSAGKYVLLLPPSVYIQDYLGEGAVPKDWTATMISSLTQKFQSEVIVSKKGDKTPFKDLVADAKAVAGFNSTALLEAARLGVNTFSLGPSAAGVLDDWQSHPEDPQLRRRHFEYLADRQFSIDEIANGDALRMMIERGNLHPGSPKL